MAIVFFPFLNGLEWTYADLRELQLVSSCRLQNPTINKRTIQVPITFGCSIILLATVY